MLLANKGSHHVTGVCRVTNLYLPAQKRHTRNKERLVRRIEESEKASLGIEPRTPGLCSECSATELRQPDNHPPGGDCRPFHFPLFASKTSNLSLFQREARVLSIETHMGERLNVHTKKERVNKAHSVISTNLSRNLS